MSAVGGCRRDKNSHLCKELSLRIVQVRLDTAPRLRLAPLIMLCHVAHAPHRVYKSHTHTHTRGSSATLYITLAFALIPHKPALCTFQDMIRCFQAEGNEVFLLFVEPNVYVQIDDVYTRLNRKDQDQSLPVSGRKHPELIEYASTPKLL